MTVHVPRWLLLGVLGLVVLGGVGFGAYRLGDRQGRDAQRDHDHAVRADAVARVERRALEARGAENAALLTHHKYELYMLRATCRYADRLADPTTGRRIGVFTPCTAMTPPPGSHVTIYGHDDRMTDVLGQICGTVAQAVTGGDALLGKNNCRPDPNEVEPLVSPTERKRLEKMAIESAG